MLLYLKLLLSLKNHPIIKKENSIKNYIKTYFKEFGPETVEKLTPSGSSPGKMYGLVKVRKDNNPVRPVVLLFCYCFTFVFAVLITLVCEIFEVIKLYIVVVYFLLLISKMQVV